MRYIKRNRYFSTDNLYLPFSNALLIFLFNFYLFLYFMHILYLYRISFFYLLRYYILYHFCKTQKQFHFLFSLPEKKEDKISNEKKTFLLSSIFYVPFCKTLMWQKWLEVESFLKSFYFLSPSLWNRKIIPCVFIVLEWNKIRNEINHKSITFLNLKFFCTCFNSFN